MLLSISAIGYLFWQNFFNKQNDATKSTEKVTKSNTKQQNQNDLYAGWKTYTSSRDGYSIKYPSDWLVVNETGNDGPYIRNFDPASKPESPREGSSNYPLGYMNLRVLLIKSDDANFKAYSGLNLSEWYGKLGVQTVKGDLGALIKPEDVNNVEVGGNTAKSIKSSFTEINEVIYLPHEDSVFQFILYPYGSSSNKTITEILNSFKTM